ncbi:MAG: phosphoribosylamine--glycine ligase [Desulfovibrio sp.]|nr:phosphoribosylamine--glycine ligase [Desulfovibrio sp.]
MQILVLGSGGREHALVWKLAKSPLVTKLYVAPGNGGTALERVENVPLKVDDLDGLVRFAQEKAIDLVIPGPELPLTLGICDAMAKAGIACFGPDKYAAQLEGSKAFAKKVMQRASVPTAACQVVSSLEQAYAAIDKIGAPLVVKADGLAAGKGVVVCQTLAEAHAQAEAMLGQHAFGHAGDVLVLEEFLQGEEVSLLCFCDGKRAVALPSAQDHKAAFDNDQGPNTGGMGAYSPAPILPMEDGQKVAQLTVQPVLDVLAGDGHPFVGILYAGLMMTSDGPKVLEYNVRFGDPECQPLLMRLESDLLQAMLDCVHGTIRPESLVFRPETALGVVIAAKGYPGSYARDLPITGLESLQQQDLVKVFHSGTRCGQDGQIVSSGGRILCVTALGSDLLEAQTRAYQAVRKLSVPQSFYRTDIGNKGVRRLNQA